MAQLDRGADGLRGNGRRLSAVGGPAPKVEALRRAFVTDDADRTSRADRATSGRRSRSLHASGAYPDEEGVRVRKVRVRAGAVRASRRSGHRRAVVIDENPSEANDAAVPGSPATGRTTT